MTLLAAEGQTWRRKTGRTSDPQVCVQGRRLGLMEGMETLRSGTHGKWAWSFMARVARGVSRVWCIPKPGFRLGSIWMGGRELRPQAGW